MGLRTLAANKRTLTRGSGSGSRSENPQSFSTSAQFPGSLATERLEQNKRAAAKLASDYPDLAGNPDVRQIEEGGFVDKAKRAVGGFLDATGLDVVLRAADTFRRLPQLALADAMQWDQEYGNEITLGNYWEVLTQQDQRLVDRVGAEVVGEFGDLSGSVFFDHVGWEKTDNFLNNIVRGSAQFLYDAATDPLTYVTGGLSAAPKVAAMEAAKVTILDASKAALMRSKGLLDDVGESAMEASMKATIREGAKELADKRLTDALTEMGEEAAKKVDKSALRDELFKEAADEVVVGVRNSWVDRVTKPIADRDFLSLPDEYVSHSATRSMTQAEAKNAGLLGAKTATEAWTTGGLRFGSPFNPRLSTGVLPGTRGLGRKLVGNPTRRVKNKVVDSVAPAYRAERAAKMFAKGAGTERGAIEAARRGQGAAALNLRAAQKAALVEVGNENGLLLMRNQLRNVVHSAGDMTDGEFDDLIRTSMHAMQNGGVIPEHVLRQMPDAVREEIELFSAIGQDFFEKMYSALGKNDVRLGHIQNYTPIRIVDEFRDNLRAWLNEGSPLDIPVGDADALRRVAADLGNDVTPEDLTVFADVMANSIDAPSGVKHIGDSTYFHQRTLGRTAVAKIDDSGMMWINEADLLDGVSVRRAYGSMEELNNGLMRVYDAIVEKKGRRALYAERKSHRPGGGNLPMRAFEDDPLHVLNSYADSVTKAAIEARVISLARANGLIKAAEYGEVVDQTLNRLAPVLDETHALATRIKEGNEVALAAMNGYQVKRQPLKLGSTTISAPVGWEKNRSIKAAVKRFNEAQAKAERRIIEIKQARDQTAARLQKEAGLSKEEARRWATASSVSLAEMRGAARQEAQDMAVEMADTIRHALLAGDEEARRAAFDRLGEVEARVAEWTQAHADAMRELTEKYVARQGDTLPQITSFTVRDGDVIDDVQTLARVTALLNTARQAYESSIQGARAHVDESIRAIEEKVALVGSRDRLSVADRQRLNHLERVRAAYEGGTAEIRSLVTESDREIAEQLLLDMRDTIEAGFAHLGKPRVEKWAKARFDGYLADKPTITAALWDDDQFRQVLAAGIRHQVGDAQIARELQKAGKRVSKAAVQRNVDERVDSIIRTMRGRFEDQTRQYKQAAADAGRWHLGGVPAFAAGDWDVALARVDDISRFIRESMGWEGNLVITKVATGKSRGSYLVEWVNDTPRVVGDNVPTLKELAAKLRAGEEIVDDGSGRLLSEVMWYRDLEDSLHSGLQEAALRDARADVERLGVPTAPRTLEGVIARLSPDGETAKVGDLFRLREIDARASTTRGAASGAERVDRLKQVISEEGWRDTGDAVPVVVYVDEVGNGTVFLGDGNHRITALHELGMDDQAVRVEFRLLDDPVAIALKQQPLEGVKYLEPTTLDELLGPRPLPLKASQKSEALRAWDDVFSKKIDAALAGKKGAATRLKNAVSTKVNGELRISSDWKALERALSIEEADKLKALIRNLVLADEAATPIEKRLLRMNNSKIMHSQKYEAIESAHQRIREVAEDLDQRAREAKSLEHRDAIAMAQQLLDTHARIVARTAQTDADGLVKGVPARLAVLDEAFREDLNLAAHLAEELGISDNMKKVARELKLDRKELGATNREVSYLKEHFRKVEDSAQVRGFREGMAPGSSRGLGGSLADVDIDPNIAVMFENMLDNMRALHTPLGVQMLQETGRGFMNLWKSQATVARPAFHTRNMISATWNNMIVGVGMRQYRKVFGEAKAFRTALHTAASIDEALEAVSESMRPVFRAAWDEGVMQSGFARSEFRNLGRANRTATRNKVLGAVNPADERFLLTEVGGYVMTRVEDFHRMAVFTKFFDPAVPETSAFAREMVNAVHFDYQNLTAIERKIKFLAPFFVWQRRNLPLQLRVMVEQPGIAQRYAHLMDAVRDNFGQDDETGDMPLSAWFNSQAQVLSGGAALGGGGGEGDFWMNFVFDPDLPIVDLESLPMFGEKGLAGTFSPGEWINFGVSMLGPHVSMPFQLGEQAEFNDVNAPVGLNEVFRALDLIDFWGGIDVSESGDVQVSYTTRSIFETLLPFYREYTAGFENDPNRQQKLGIPQDSRDILDVVKGYTNSLGKGFGIHTQTPGDTKSAAYEAQEILRDLRLRRQKGIG